mgnify:CR=1 FL=1
MDQIFKVSDFAHGNDSKLAKLGMDENGLRIRIADDTNTRIPG